MHNAVLAGQLIADIFKNNFFKEKIFLLSVKITSVKKKKNKLTVSQDLNQQSLECINSGLSKHSGKARQSHSLSK